MADLIQISTPNPSQSYNNQNHSNRTQIQQNPTGQVFDLGNQTEIVKTNDRTGDNAQQNLKDDSGAVLMRSPADSIKNPSSALNTAKELIASETISLIRESGDTEALSKLMEFADEVMLSPETLVKDMAAQQKNSTIFGDKLWTVLKGLTDISQSKAFESAVADFAKASVDITSKDKILQSLSANFKYLAGEAAPSKAISDELLAASKALAGTDAQTNFNALKPTLLKLLGFTEKSILLNDSTKNLLPLIIHSMSRYNDNPDALKESFTSLVQQSENINLTQQELTNLGLDPQKSLADNLKTIFDRYI